MPKKIEIDIEVNSGKATANSEKLGKSLNKSTKAADGTSKSTNDLSSSSTALGGGLGAAAAGAQKLLLGFKALILSPIGLVIGSIAVALLAVKTAFTSSEAGQNKYNKVMGVLGSILGNLTDLLSDFGEMLIGAFENPQKALNDFGSLIKDNIQNRFEGLMELIPQLGKAITLLFEGEFSEAGKVAANATAKVALGIDNISDKIESAAKKSKEFIAQLEADGNAAALISDKRAKADKIERDLIVKRAEADKQIAALRDKAGRKDLFSLEERKNALVEASKISEDIVKQEVSAAQLRAEAITLENTLSKSNKDALKQEEEAKAKVIQLQTKNLNLQKRLGTELSALNLQGISENNKATESAIKHNEKIIELQQKLQDKKREFAIKNESDVLIKRQLQEDDIEIEKQQAADKHARNLENSFLTLEAKAISEQALFDQNEGFRQAKVAIDDMAREEKFLKEEAAKNKEIKQQKESAAAFATVEQTKKKIRDQGLNNVIAGANLLSSLGDKSKKLQAAAIIATNASEIAKTIISTQSANAAIVAQGAALAIPSAGASVATAAGLVASNNISAGISVAGMVVAAGKGLSKLGKSGGVSATMPSMSSGGGGRGGNLDMSQSAAAPTLSPDTLFSTATPDGIPETEEIGQGVGQNQRAYVVESDITNAQNNIESYQSSSEIG